MSGTLPILKQGDFWSPQGLAEEESLVSPEWLSLEV